MSLKQTYTHTHKRIQSSKQQNSGTIITTRPDRISQPARGKREKKRTALVMTQKEHTRNAHDFIFLQ